MDFEHFSRFSGIERRQTMVIKKEVSYNQTIRFLLLMLLKNTPY